MEFDPDELYRWIVEELSAGRPIAGSMARLIDWCEKVRPHPDWSVLRELPYGGTYEMVEWLQRPFREQPPAELLRGLWFGLFNPCYAGRDPVADIYVSGTTRFDPDPSVEWTVRPAWWPDARYAHSPILADIYRIGYQKPDGLGNDAEFPLCLGYAAFLVRDILESVEPDLILGDSDSLGVAVGFDSGDLILIGILDRSGLDIRPRA